MTMHPSEEIRVLQEHAEYLNAENAKLRAALDRLYWYASRLELVVYGEDDGEHAVMEEARAALEGK